MLDAQEMEAGREVVVPCSYFKTFILALSCQRAQGWFSNQLMEHYEALVCLLTCAEQYLT